MIDGFKMRLRGVDDINSFLLETNSELSETLIENHGKGNIKFKELYFDWYRFEVQELTLIVRRSLPVILNGNNHEDLTPEGVLNAIICIEEILCYPLKKFELFKLEIGVNVLLNQTVNPFMKSMKNCKDSPFRFVGNYKSLAAMFDQYFVKIYDKCRQTKGRVPERTLRTELVVTESAPLKKMGIKWINRSLLCHLRRRYSAKE